MPTQPIAGLNSAWTLYRQCAATSAFQKSRLTFFTKLSVWLGIIGALIASVAQGVAWRPGSTESKIMGAVGGLAVALAGLAATQAVADNREKIWIKCRGAGEGLKSAIYLFCASAAPFDGPARAESLRERLDKALKDLEGTELRPASADSHPPGPLTVDEYIKARVDDQITWYIKKAADFQRRADFWRYFSVSAAAVSAALGAVSAIYSLSPWIALLATITASITAYVKNQRYSAIIGLYQATAIRLQYLKDQWLDSGKTEVDKPERDAFIQGCEQTMSIENGAWTSQWLQQPLTPTRPALAANN